MRKKMIPPVLLADTTLAGCGSSTRHVEGVAGREEVVGNEPNLTIDVSDPADCRRHG